MSSDDIPCETNDVGNLTALLKAPIMSLPGLQLDAPSEPTLVQTVHEIKEATEWRFEVAFGSRIEVKVCCPRSCMHPGLS